jgi:Mn2+/Fe2+ NRAMP family transporter
LAVRRCSTGHIRTGCLTAEILIPYHLYAGYLKFLTWVLFVYVATAFTVAVPWLRVLHSTFLPSLSLDPNFLTMVVAIFGTTISPYLFFWQASQEAEESRLSHRSRYKARFEDGRQSVQADRPRHVGGDARFQCHRLLHHCHHSSHPRCSWRHQNRDRRAGGRGPAPNCRRIDLRLFAAGIIGTGLLAVPVLAGSAAYAVAEAFGIRGSLELPASRALGFYAIIGAATLGGAALAMTDIDPIAMLFWTAVLNGIVSVPIMAAMMLAVSGKSHHRRLALPRWLQFLGWLATALMAVAGWAFAWTSI